jgi:hypothetical protein
MENRRTILTLAGSLASVSLFRASAADAVFPGKPTEDTPQATLIPGAPPILDFGDGLKIICDKSAFLTLWEGKTFWMTFGAGRSSYSQRAAGEAVLYAQAAMKLLLMTLAFAPDRLELKDGGWRLKVQDTRYYVLGDIKLPGKPYWPITDAGGIGDQGGSIMSLPESFGGGGGSDPGGVFGQVSAFTAYIVMKKDVDLNYVRARADLLPQ